MILFMVNCIVLYDIVQVNHIILFSFFGCQAWHRNIWFAFPDSSRLLMVAFKCIAITNFKFLELS